MEVIKIKDYIIKKINISEYYNRNIKLDFICMDNSTYGTITVNFPETIPSGFAYLNTNNFKYIVNLEEIFKTYDFGIFTGLYKQSGYCDYPLYYVNLYNINKYNTFMQKKAH